MKKRTKLLIFTIVLGIAVYMISLASDKKQLQTDILRLHVVGASDSEEDQTVKLYVRDAVLAAVEAVTFGAENKAQAQILLSENLDLLEQAANETLAEHGFAQRACVSLGQEAFPKREYDTFALPAGIYDSLRVTIGKGEGRNWWCVVFPSLCIPAASNGTRDVAAGAGFSDTLSGAITGDEQYEVRFFLLDVWGRIENFFVKEK
jgi:stage II sporulation protein R